MEIHAHSLIYFTLVFYRCIHDIIAEPRLKISAPINPVDESGILSIHCQVWDLQRGYEVTLIRILSEGSERLSVNEDVLNSVEERVFVASRQLPDGSVVYFLSIIDVSRQDTGEYVCKVLATSGTSDELPSESIYIESTYFPSESDPVCSPNTPLIVQAGKELTFNCSSEAAFPTVSLGWERNGAKSPLKFTEHIDGNKVYSSLTLTPSMKDNKAILICKVTSRSFPGKTRTCHVGPLTVQSQPNQDISFPPSHGDTAISTPDTARKDTPFPNNIDIWTEKLPEECRSICSTTTSVFFWVLATVIAATIAFIFFIVCLGILFKYNSMNDAADNRPYLPGQLTAEEIYSEVEQKCENRLYMALNKSDGNPNMDGHNYITTNARRL